MPRLRHPIEQILAKLREMEIRWHVAWLMTLTTITSWSESAGAGGIGNMQVMDTTLPAFLCLLQPRRLPETASRLEPCIDS
jgi:hypothetical protein